MEDNNSQNKNKKGFEEESNSVIKIILDQFAITYAIKKIFDKTSINITRYFNDAAVLFIFLFFVFWQSNVLGCELSIPTITLGLLFFLLIIEFIGANTPYLKKFLFSEEKAKKFIDNISAYRTTELQKNLDVLRFNPNNINYLLEIFQKEKIKIPQFVLEEILLYNTLSIENLNRLFSPNILKLYINKELVKNLLIKYYNKLSPDNIDNIYSVFKQDEELVKVLFATQKDSYYILEHEQNDKIREFYDRYHKNNEKRSKISKFVKRTKIDIIKYRIFAITILWPFLFFLIILVACYLAFVNTANAPDIILYSFIISFLVVTLLIIPIINRCAYFWIDNAKSKFYKEL